MVFRRKFKLRSFRKKRVPKVVRKYVKKTIVNQKESKQIVTTVSTTPERDNPDITPISLMAEGDSNLTREGDEIYGMYLDIRCDITVNQLLPAISLVFVRTMIVCDTQCNGSTFAIAELLTNVGANNPHLSPQREDSLARFKVIFDKLQTLTQVCNAAGTEPQQADYPKKIVKRIPLKRVMRYLNPDAEIADTGKNALFLVTLTNRDDAVVNHVCQANLVYKDK